MKITMLLADSAQAVGGKLYILGGGWSVTGPNPTTFGVAVKVEVPYDQANIRHQWKLQLLDQDGNAVQLPSPLGDQEVVVGGEFETGRPPGIPRGAPLDWQIAINFESIPIPPGGRFVWRFSVNEDHAAEAAFTTRSGEVAGP